MKYRPYHGDTRPSLSHVRLAVLLLISTLLVAALGMRASLPRQTVGAAYTWSSTPSWTEEFTSLSNWTIETGDGCAIGICGWGNNEKEYYTNSSTNIKTTTFEGLSVLAITARKESGGKTCYYGTCQYTSGKIKSNYKFQYGKVEARIKMDYTGQGLWPAFWMLGSNGQTWPANGEIDIMENKGRYPNETSAAIHSPNHSGGGNIGGARTLGSSITANWHLFRVEWEDSEIRFYSDNTLFKTVNKSAVGTDSWPFDDANNNFYFILNLAVGGNFDGDPPSTATYFPATMYVDYIKVYPKAATSATPTRTATTSSTTCGTSNAALNKPVTSSQSQGTSSPTSAVDGNSGTRWESAHGVDPGWVRVDLGASKTICRVRLNWEAAYGKAYQIQVSGDGSSWTPIYSTTTGDGAVDDRTGLSGTGRYVRVYGTTRATGYGYSLWDFEIFTR